LPVADDARAERRPPELVVVPKPGGGVRWLAILGPADDAVYRRAVRRLSEMIERVLGPEVVANRVATGPGLRLRPWRSERRTFVRSSRSLLGTGAVVVKADVRECYPSIRSEMVERALIGLGAWRSDVIAVWRILDRFGGDGIAGLPIGPDPSAVLANAVLVTADDAVRAAGGRHVRWVDDVWAIARNERHADELLDRLRRDLAAIGLSLNEAKTRILDRGEAMTSARGRGVLEDYR
jgi:hypothetical protein